MIMINRKEQVNHPEHYNSHPAGVECIDVVRHYEFNVGCAIKYLWRAGLKTELGKDDAEKEIEDLKKALWYLDDYKGRSHLHTTASEKRMRAIVRELTGHDVSEIIRGYEANVAAAMESLLLVGVVRRNEVRCIAARGDEAVGQAEKHIRQRILDIELHLVAKEASGTVAVMNGEAVDGVDYATPGGVRDTEPDSYDPLNIVIIQGSAYCLADDVRRKPNGSLFTPCQNCDLQDLCWDDWRCGDEHSPRRDFCQMHDARTNQYYREVGAARYSPSYGTIEVVDEMKELEKEAGEMTTETTGW